jgi:hypothetical protein
VLVYNRTFEKRVLKELGESLPGLRKRLNAVAEGMIDLMEPFKRRDIYHWRMNGSYSLKSVLPVLVPEMTYDGMEISDGAMASEAYFTMGLGLLVSGKETSKGLPILLFLYGHAKYSLEGIDNIFPRRHSSE